MTNQNINDGIADDMSQRAVSIYGQNDGVEDFPVLKAFQQYIDAEQEKARKRIIWLGIFFGGILVIVVAVFLFMLHGINMRNQSLSDRLVEYAMSERRQSAPYAQPVATGVQQQQSSDAVLKSMTETLLALQRKMQDGASATSGAPITTADPLLGAKMLEETEKINRAKARLEAEKQQLAQERERLRQIEIDRQRRKLYPELYADEGEGHAPSRSRKARTLTDDDIREIIREAYSDTEEEKAEKARQAEKDAKKRKEADEDVPIDYFKDDNYDIPVNVKGSSSQIKFTVPVE